MDDIRVNGDTILENVPAILDTGSNLIYGDGERVSELYRRLGGTLKDYKGFDFYYCEFRFRSGTLFLSTAYSTLRLFPNSELYLRWQDICNLSRSSQTSSNRARFFQLFQHHCRRLGPLVYR
jgi:hypothetical protein